MNIETKFDIGDVVKYVGVYEICSSTITDIHIEVIANNTPHITYNVGNSWLNENRIFANANELINYIKREYD